jgi:hypothetical protein
MGHQFLAYADDVNLLGDNIDTAKKNTEILNDNSKKIGLEINIEKTKYRIFSNLIRTLFTVSED